MQDDQVKLPLSEVAYRRLKEMIIDLELRPGELLVSQHLSNTLNLSRTPVRDALVRLTQEHLVVPVEGNKFKVSEITLTSIMDLYELRKIIEGYAIVKAVGNVTHVDIEAFEQDLSGMKEAFSKPDFDEFFQLDYRFHLRLVEVCGNTHMIRIINNLQDHIQRIRYFTLDIEGRVGNTITEHEDILMALKSGDTIKAEQALMVHLDQVESGFDEMLKTDNKVYLHKRLMMT